MQADIIHRPSAASTATVMMKAPAQVKAGPRCHSPPRRAFRSSPRPPHQYPIAGVSCRNVSLVSCFIRNSATSAREIQNRLPGFRSTPTR